MSKYDEERERIEQIKGSLNEAYEVLDAGWANLIGHPQQEELERRLNEVRHGLLDTHAGCRWFLSELGRGESDE